MLELRGPYLFSKEVTLCAALSGGRKGSCGLQCALHWPLAPHVPLAAGAPAGSYAPPLATGAALSGGRLGSYGFPCAPAGPDCRTSPPSLPRGAAGSRPLALTVAAQRLHCMGCAAQVATHRSRHTDRTPQGAAQSHCPGARAPTPYRSHQKARPAPIERGDRSRERAPSVVVAAAAGP